MFECKFKSTSSSWYRNGRRRKLTDASECLWHALKDCSDSWGAIQVDEDDIVHVLFAGRKGWDHKQAVQCLAQLVKEGLIALYEHDGNPWIQVLRHDDYQSPRFIGKRGARTSPERLGNGANSRHITPKGVPGSPDDPPIMAKAIAIAKAPSGASSTDAVPAPPTTASEVRDVFDYWKSAFGKNGGTVLDSPRRKRIEWALKTYGIAEAKRCIDGYAADPWPDRKRHHELTLLMRDAGHVERGLQLADAISTDETARSRFDEYN